VALSYQNVSFWYRHQRESVLDSVTWSIPAGKTVLLGPNGAGKTTMLRIGATSLRPRNGSVCMDDLDASRRGDLRKVRASIGWMPQEIRPIAGLTCHEQVAYVGWLKGLTRSDAWAAASDVIDAVSLMPERDRPAAELSGGQLRRVGLAQALVASPRFLLLDEPTAGLDPSQRSTFRRLLDDIPLDVTVLVSTHQVDDLSDLFDTVAIMDEGRILWQGTVDEFLSHAPDGSPRPAEAAFAVVTGPDA
jgi:ABC-2 type transport system ATP-binding protein